MRSFIPLATALAALVMPGAALASTVSMEANTAVFRSGAKASDVVLGRLANGDPTFTDALQPLSAGVGCVGGVPVVCPNSFAQTLRLGAGSDRVKGFSFSPVSVIAAGGNDDVQMSGNSTDVDAGPGDDHVVAGSNGLADVVAGDGNDAIRSDVGTNADLAGNGGDDLMVAVTPGENHITGGGGNDDVIVMPRNPNTLGGGFGTITTAAGDDAILVRSEGVGIGYTIDSGADIDTIYGGKGIDTVIAGGGNDLIDVFGDHNQFGGGVDTVNCGPGADTVFADPEDVIAANCEWVEYAPIPQPWAATRALEHLAASFPELTPPAL
jgi:Ca2+-binding RTX toxin-like protein